MRHRKRLAVVLDGWRKRDRNRGFVLLLFPYVGQREKGYGTLMEVYSVKLSRKRTFLGVTDDFHGSTLCAFMEENQLPPLEPKAFYLTLLGISMSALRASMKESDISFHGGVICPNPNPNPTLNPLSTLN